MEGYLLALTLAIFGYTAGSIKVIQQGNEAIVERLGRFHRRLKPGLNFVVPLLDSVLEETTREQTLDIEPHAAVTRDQVSVSVDAIMYWKILDVEKAYYSVEDLDGALKNLVITTLRSEIGEMSLAETFASRTKVNQELLRQLDEATAGWGVKVTRVEVQEVKISERMQEALEQERAAESKKKATLAETSGIVQSVEQISKALESHPNAQSVLKYLLVQRFVDANFKLGESNNSKIIFMDPKSMTETIGELIASDPTDSGIPMDNNKSD